MLGLNILAEALLRLEHKLDLLVLAAYANSPLMPTMSFKGLTCPVCNQEVKYSIDMVHRVVKRNCGCSTNLVVPTFDLVGTGANQNAKSKGTPSVQSVEIGDSGS